jgi:hypothetical protein
MGNFRCTCLVILKRLKSGYARPNGRPKEKIEDNPHPLSFTDAEYAKLGELAKAAKLGSSEFIIDRLGLDE